MLTPRVHQAFVAPDNRLRVGWRLALFFAIAIGAGGVLGQLVGFADAHIGFCCYDELLPVSSTVAAIGILAATYVLVRFVDPVGWRYVGLDRGAARGATVGRGFVNGALAIGVPIVIMIAAHLLRRIPEPINGTAAGSWVSSAVAVSVFLLPAALVEELLARGYFFSALREGLGLGWAWAITSVGFGLMHVANPGVTGWSIALVILAGVWLAAVRFATGSLYAAWAAHFAWNWVMAVPFHTDVSGIPFAAPGYRMVSAGPTWLTGGAWGPEAGVPAALGMLAATGYIIAGSRRHMER